MVNYLKSCNFNLGSAYDKAVFLGTNGALFVQGLLLDAHAVLLGPFAVTARNWHLRIVCRLLTCCLKSFCSKSFGGIFCC
jgi:hypothetical protein